VTLMADEDGIEPSLAVRLRQLRATYRLTQTQLAGLIGVSFASVNRWENGQRQPQMLARQWIERAERFGLAGVVAPSGEAATIAAASEEPAMVLDFQADPGAVRVVAEGERLASGHLVNAAFATELSLIEPLPHQRIAVYEHMLTQTHLRFLLADDAGAGKTIMSGLYIREMLNRRLLSRVLVVPPAGLVLNWERELNGLFGLPFRVVGGGEGRSGNPFLGPESDLLIVSVDTLAAERLFGRLQELDVEPYDLVIFDEVHKLSADREPDFTVRKTDRYRLAEALAGIPSDDQQRDWLLDWSARHLLLLTATPHMGKDYPYYFLWRLLQPDALSTFNAWSGYPAEARRRHFIRRTKEEMVRFDGSRIYPTRESATLSYDLTKGPTSEQTLYDGTTTYMDRYYNRAVILNRSAARLALSVFQRRLASSTYALLRSFQRRLVRLDEKIDDLRSGRVSIEQMAAGQRRLSVHDLLEEQTADEEQAEGGREGHERAEDDALQVFALSLDQLEAEREQVRALIELAQRVYDNADESKFEKLREVLKDPAYADEKLIIFTEHRDTLQFLVRRLEGLGFAGQVAHIHGGMDVHERDAQVQQFRRPASAGGATYLVATDAAEEGINLQFCWLMVNYDVPWNPARLEQRMGRIHRYGQRHDPVVILNLIAGKTREGKVLKTLLDKLERIRAELGSDKVYDVIGQLFQGVSLRDYMRDALTEEGVANVERLLAGTLTAEQVTALQQAEQRRYGDGDDVARELPRLRAELEDETYRRLLPGYVRGFVAEAAPLLGLRIEGDLSARFALHAAEPHAMDPLLSALERYETPQQAALSVVKPDNGEPAIFLRPGESVFEALRQQVMLQLGPAARRGAVFRDAGAERPYLFHLVRLTVVRQADPELPALRRGETLETRLVGLRQELDGAVTDCPVETLLLLSEGADAAETLRPLAAQAESIRPATLAFVRERVAPEVVREQVQRREATLVERLRFVERGFGFQESELLEARSRLRRKDAEGDTHARGELTRVRERQRTLATRKNVALTALRREPELIELGEVEFVAHALVLPTDDPEEERRQDARAELLAVRVVRDYEESRGAIVTDASTPDRARAAGLPDHPGFDLLSRRPDGAVLNIEVKGRAGNRPVEMTENEYAKACNLGDDYWLYAVFDCASLRPRLARVQNPFVKLIARARGSVLIAADEVLANAEGGLT